MQRIQVSTHEPDLASRTFNGRWLTSLLAVLMLLGGFAAGRLLVPQAPAEGSPEVAFARDMAAHHDQAVEMAVMLRDRGTNEELRAIALDIILTQQAQSGQMQGWLAVWGRPLAGAGPPMGGLGEMMGMATVDEINRLASLSPAETEVLFLQLMIRHHQGGIMMGRQAQTRTRRLEVVRLAAAIVNSQQNEIDAMETMLRARGAPLPAPVEPMLEHGGHT